MSDMAEWALEHDSWLNDEADEDADQPLTFCRNCKAIGLWWERVDRKWRLWSDGGIHVCPIAPLPQHRGVNR